jgi:hypothetical protein
MRSDNDSSTVDLVPCISQSPPISASTSKLNENQTPRVPSPHQDVPLLEDDQKPEPPVINLTLVTDEKIPEKTQSGTERLISKNIENQQENQVEVASIIQKFPDVPTIEVQGNPYEIYVIPFQEGLLLFFPRILKRFCRSCIKIAYAGKMHESENNVVKLFSKFFENIIYL